jgi:hypothetical protein
MRVGKAGKDIVIPMQRGRWKGRMGGSMPDALQPIP